jgi:hypothetical protein
VAPGASRPATGKDRAATYLLLAYRRQRLDEVDTRERRITELWFGVPAPAGHSNWERADRKSGLPGSLAIPGV